MTEELWQVLVVLNTIGLLVVGIVILGLARQLGAISLRLSPARPGELDGGGPEIGAVIDANVPTEAGLLVFVSPGCTLCDYIAPSLGPLQRDYPEVALAVVVGGAEDEDRDRYAERYGSAARLDISDLFDEWEITGTPYAVGIANQEVVGKGVVNTLEHVEALVELVLEKTGPDQGSTEASDLAEVRV